MAGKQARPLPAHGTRARYRRGCRSDTTCPATPTCRQANNRERKATEWRAAGLLTRLPADRVDPDRARAHLQVLLKVPNATAQQVAGLAGVTGRTMLMLLRPAGRGRIHYRTEKRIRAVTVEQVAATTYFVPGELVWRLCRSMQAQGFPQRYIAARVGATVSNLFPCGQLRRRVLITRETEGKVRALAAQMEGKTGPSPRSATHANALGFYPLAAYGDDGELIPGAVRSEAVEARKAARDRAARDRLGTLRATLAGVSAVSIAAATGCEVRQVVRYRAEAGVSAAAARACRRARNPLACFLVWRACYYAALHMPAAAAPAARVLQAARIAHAKTVLDAYDVDPLADAYETCLAVGMMVHPRWQIGQPGRRKNRAA